MLKILTLSWQGNNKLARLYPTFLNALNDIDYEWWIKDNGSTDGSIVMANEWHNDRVHMIAHPNNVDSFALGCNRLFSWCEPQDDDLILLLNNDIIFNDKHSLKKMINIMKDQSVGVVGAKLTYTNTNKLQHAGVVFDQRLRLPTHYRANEMDDGDASKNREFQAITGAVMLTRASLYKNICTTNKSGLPGQDESLIWAFDDTCACLAIKYNMGKKIVYCGQTNISHDESATLKKNPVNKMFMLQNINHVKTKWGSFYKADRRLYDTNPNYLVYKG